MVFTNSLSSYYEKFLATGEVKCIEEEFFFKILCFWGVVVMVLFFISQKKGFELELKKKENNQTLIINPIFYWIWFYFLP